MAVRRLSGGSAAAGKLELAMRTPIVVQAPSIGDHRQALFHIHTFKQLADAAQLMGIGGNDIFGMLAHLLFQELEEACDQRIAFVSFCLAARNRFRRQQHRTVGKHG